MLGNGENMPRAQSSHAFVSGTRPDPAGQTVATKVGVIDGDCTAGNEDVPEGDAGGVAAADRVGVALADEVDAPDDANEPIGDFVVVIDDDGVAAAATDCDGEGDAVFVVVAGPVGDCVPVGDTVIVLLRDEPLEDDRVGVLKGDGVREVVRDGDVERLLEGEILCELVKEGVTELDGVTVLVNDGVGVQLGSKETPVCVHADGHEQGAHDKEPANAL